MDAAEFLSALGDYGFLDTPLARKIEKLQSAIWDIERRKPWPFLEQTILLNYAGGSAVASNTPSDLRTVRRMRDLVTGTRLTPMRLDDADDWIGTQTTQSGDPVLYYLDAGQLKVWPLPTASTGRIQLRHIRRSPAISDSSAESAFLIPATNHEVVLFGALMRLYDMEDDVELAQRFQQLYEQGIQNMIDDVFLDQLDRTDYIHVYDPDDWDWE